MRPKIRCDRWKRKYFGLACEVNTAMVYKIDRTYSDADLFDTLIPYTGTRPNNRLICLLVQSVGVLYTPFVLNYNLL
jgi:hypothetical protein